jgi:membrane protein DedA with SNARE-associated domain
MSASPLPGVLGSVAPVLDHYGYLALGGIIMVESFGVPSPGETILVAASVYAGAGRLNVVAVGLIAMAAAVIGNTIGYAIGYYGGHALVVRFGKYVLLTSKRLEKAESFFARRGGVVIVVGRFLEGLRQATGIIAGIAEMPFRRFTMFNVLGAALWVAVWESLGYLAGDHIQAIYGDIVRYSLYLLIALVVAAAAAVVYAVARHRGRRAAAERGTAGGDTPAAGTPGKNAR